jgi:2-polyprenyl-6-methoxyphenol hydroxylase-like FAD-dependent oxidoreductase
MKDIGIVGAGPVGLTLACILQMNGQSFRIYEQEIQKQKISKAFAIHARTLELFRTIGVDEEILKEGRAIRKMNLYAEKNRLGTVDFSHLQSEFDYFVSIPQYRLEEILYDRLKLLGGNVDWGNTVVAIEKNSVTEEKIILGIENKTQKNTAATHRYVVASDGAHSPVRKILGVKFSGDTYDSEFLVVDARIQWKGNNYEAHTFLSKHGYLMVMPFPGLKHRVVTDIPTGYFKQPPTLDNVHALLHSKGFNDIQLTQPDWISATRYHKRLSDKFRIGNVFLAGDACHIHSPIGGLGLNTGIQDAFNLGWKLSTVLSGEASPQLLDTYEIERREIAQQVLANTDAMTKRFADKNPIKLFVRKFIMPLAFSSPKVQKKLTSSASGIAVGYEQLKTVFPSKFAGKLLPGQRLPDPLVHSQGTLKRLHRVLDTNKYSLLLFADNHVSTTTIATLPALLGGYMAPPVIFTLLTSESISTNPKSLVIDNKARSELLKGNEGIVLVRADGYVAYTAEKIDRSELKQVLDSLLLPVHSINTSENKLFSNDYISPTTNQQEKRDELVL